MSVRGKWRVTETPEHDMAGPNSYILFAEDGGEFALDCLTGSIHGGCEGNAVEFTWDGNDEMEPATGHGWAEIRTDGSLGGEISLQGGDDIPFIAPIGYFFNSLLEGGQRLILLQRALSS
jgi:hypothetical protein